MLTVLDSIDAMIYVADIKTYEILFINRFGKGTWGDIRGKICWQVLHREQKGQCSFCTNHKIVDINGQPGDIYRWEYYNQVVDRWYVCIDRAITWSDGRVVRLQVAFDITDRKNNERKLNQYTEELEAKKDELETAYNIINEDLKKAFYLHSQILSESFSNIDHISIAAYHKPTQYLGGDLYGVHEIDSRVLFYIVDVSGHGMDGTILSIFTRENITNYLLVNKQTKAEIEPHKVIEYVKDRFYEESFPEEYFICMLVGILDTSLKTVSFANAGIQIYPLIADNQGKSKKVKAKGLPISKTIKPSLYEYYSLTTSYGSGSSIFITTDGLIEEEINGTYYDIKRVKNILASNNDKPPEVVKNTINSDFYSFAGTFQGKDDITYLILNTDEILYKKRFTIDSTIESPGELLEELMPIAEKYLEDSGLFIMAIYELLVNAVEHGNKFALDKKVEVELRVTEQYIYTAITDQGDGFDWQIALEKEYDYLSLDDRGRGIGLSKMYVHHLSYNPKGNKASIVYYRY